MNAIFLTVSYVTKEIYIYMYKYLLCHIKLYSYFFPI